MKFSNSPFHFRRASVRLGISGTLGLCLPLMLHATEDEVTAPEANSPAAEVVLPEAVLNASPEPDPNSTETNLDSEFAKALTPVNNYSLLRLLPGVNGGLNNKDRFGGPVSIRGGITWGIAQTIDDYPSIDVVPVAAEDGGFTANLSSIIPSIALSNLSIDTGDLGVKYGQATGGVIRSQLKRGNAEDPYSGIHAEYNTIGEAVGMAETSGGGKGWDYYVAAQSVYGDFGNKYKTHPRPLQNLTLNSGLAKIGYRPSERGRIELLAIGGREDHEYYRLAGGTRTDYETEKDNLFVGVRYDHTTNSDLRWDIGTTFTDFHENRINQNSGLSERNRPQKATKVFANLTHDHTWDDWSWFTAHGAEYTDDYFSDITGDEVRFNFSETSVYTRHNLHWRERIKLNLGLRGSRIDNAFQYHDHLAHNAGVAVVVKPVGEFHVSHFTGYRLNKAQYLFWGNGAHIQRDPAVGLDPSESETWEFGWKRPIAIFDGPGNIRITYFTTTESRLFNFADSGTGVPFYDKGEAQGIEAWLDWNPVPTVKLFAGYSHLKNRRVDSTNPAANNTGLRFTPLPEDTVSIGGSWQFADGWTWTLTGLYDSGSMREFYDNGVRETETFESFVRVDTAMAWAINDHWTVFGRIENLLDNRDLGYSAVREESDGTTTSNDAEQRDPGILFALGAQARF